MILLKYFAMLFFVVFVTTVLGLFTYDGHYLENTLQLCLNNLNMTKKKFNSLRRKKKGDPTVNFTYLGCLHACVHEKLGMMVKEKYSAEVSQYVGTQMAKELEGLDSQKIRISHLQCARKANKYRKYFDNKCDLAYNFTECSRDYYLRGKVV